MVYAGQEKGCQSIPALFERDPVCWAGNGAGQEIDLSSLIAHLAQLKKDSIFAESSYQVQALSRDFMAAVHMRNRNSLEVSEQGADEMESQLLLGIFSLKGEAGAVSLEEIEMPVQS